jgi:hypothetical protein
MQKGSGRLCGYGDTKINLEGELYISPTRKKFIEGIIIIIIITIIIN